MICRLLYAISRKASRAETRAEACGDPAPFRCVEKSMLCLRGQKAADIDEKDVFTSAAMHDRTSEEVE